MANSTTTTILSDGPRNTRVMVRSILDTADLTSTTVADPATLSDMTAGSKATTLRIDKIDYACEPTLTVNLYWDATSPVLIGSFNGQGNMDNFRFQDLNNTKASGYTGKILVSTQGWAASGVLSFTLILSLVKQ